MGKNVSVYITDENALHFDLCENKSQLINNLLNEHYNNSEQSLNLRLENIEIEKSTIKAKLKILNDRKKAKNQETQAKEKEDLEKLQNEALVNKWKDLWSKGDIDDTKYWSAYNEETKSFGLDLIKEFVEKLE